MPKKFLNSNTDAIPSLDLPNVRPTTQCTPSGRQGRIVVRERKSVVRDGQNELTCNVNSFETNRSVVNDSIRLNDDNNTEQVQYNSLEIETQFKQLQEKCKKNHELA